MAKWHPKGSNWKKSKNCIKNSVKRCRILCKCRSVAVIWTRRISWEKCYNWMPWSPSSSPSWMSSLSWMRFSAEIWIWWRWVTRKRDRGKDRNWGTMWGSGLFMEWCRDLFSRESTWLLIKSICISICRTTLFRKELPKTVVISRKIYLVEQGNRASITKFT